MGDWMVMGDGIVNGIVKEPSQKLVAEWLVDVYTNLPAKREKCLDEDGI